MYRFNHILGRDKMIISKLVTGSDGKSLKCSIDKWTGERRENERCKMGSSNIHAKT